MKKLFHVLCAFLAIGLASLHSQSISCGDLEVRAGTPSRQSCADCYEVIVPFYFTYIGTADPAPTTFAVCGMQLTGQFSAAPPNSDNIRLIEVCTPLTDNNNNNRAVSIDITLDDYSRFNFNTSTTAGTWTFDFGSITSPAFELVLEVPPGAVLDIDLNSFDYWTSTNCTQNCAPPDGTVPPVYLDRSIGLEDIYIGLPSTCTNTSYNFEIGAPTQNGNEYAVPVKINTGGSSISLSRLDFQIDMDDSPYENLTVVTNVNDLHQDIKDYGNPLYTVIHNMNTSKVYLTANTTTSPMVFNNGDQVALIRLSTPTNPEAGSAVDLSFDYVITKESGTSGECCAPDFSDTESFTLQGVLPCATQDYKVVISGPDPVIDECLRKYTVSLEYIGSGASSMKFGSFELAMNLLGSNFTTFTKDLACLGGGCSSVDSNDPSKVFYSTSNDLDWDISSSYTLDLFEVYVDGGSATGVSHATAEGDVDFRNNVFVDEPNCVPVAVENESGYTSAGNFSISTSTLGINKCQAKFAVNLNYNGSGIGTLDLANINLETLISATGTDLEITPIAGPSHLFNCPPCLSKNQQTITYNTSAYSNPISFAYNGSTSMTLFEIIVESSNGSVSSLTFNENQLYWSAGGYTEAVCLPTLNNATNINATLKGESVNGSITNHCQGNSGVSGVDVCIKSGTSSCGTGDCISTLMTGSNGTFKTSVNEFLCSKPNENLYAIPNSVSYCGGTRGILCGVTTFDLVLISKHILSVEPLNSPYKIIAADANNSKSVTTLDLVALRKLILRVEDELPNNTCWRFIDASYTFPNQQNPFQEVFPECASLTNGSANFVGVKIGDVNCNCDGFSLTTNVLNFEITDTDALENDYIDVYMRSTNFTNIAAFQMGISFDTDYLSYVGVDAEDLSGVSETDNFNVADASSGKIRALWYDTTGRTVASTAKLFKLRFQAVQDFSTLDGLISFDDNDVLGRAYKGDGTELGIALTFSSPSPLISNGGIRQHASSSAGAELSVQAVPNPFKHTTALHINAPQAYDAAVIDIYDGIGAKLGSVKQALDKGTSIIELDILKNLPKGIYTYTITAGESIATGKIVKGN